MVGCSTSHQHASVSQGRICTDNLTCCHTEIEVAYPTPHLTLSQCIDTGPAGPITDPITPGARQSSHWSANFEVTGMTRPRKKSRRKRDSNPGSSALEVDALTTRPTMRYRGGCPAIRLPNSPSRHSCHQTAPHDTHVTKQPLTTLMSPNSPSRHSCHQTAPHDTHVLLMYTEPVYYFQSGSVTTFSQGQ